MEQEQSSSLTLRRTSQQALSNQSVLNSRQGKPSTDDRNCHLIQKLHFANIGVNKEGIIVDWNLEAEALFGWKAETLIGLNLWETLIPPALISHYQLGFKKLFQVRSFIRSKNSLKLSLLTHEKTKLTVDAFFSFCGTANQRILYAYLTQPSRVESKENFNESETRFHILMELVSDGVMLIDSTKILLVNSALEQLLKTPASQPLIGSSPWSLFHPTFYQFHKVQIKAALLNQAHSSNLHEAPKENLSALGSQLRASELGFEGKMVTNHGETLDVKLTSQKVSYHSNPAWLIIVHDQTQSKKQEIVNALDVNNTFLGTASHEIKTPLTSLEVLMGLARLKIKQNHLDYFTPEKLTQFIEKSSQQVAKLSKLAHELFQTDEAQRGNLKIKKEYFDLNKTVNQQIEKKMKENPLLDSPFIFQNQKPLFGYWDREKIEQVIEILLSNAIKFGENKPVLISLDQEKEFARLSIQDHGTGMEKLTVSEVFQPFHKSPAHSQHKRGLGLNLYIASQFIQFHHGTIKVQSSPRQGSTFTVKIPLHS